MSVFIDLTLLAIFVVCIFLGYKKGLVGLVLRLCSFLLALIVALVLFKPVSNFVINNTNYYDNLKSYIVEIATKDSNTENVSNENSSNGPEFIANYINSSIEKATAEAKENVIEYVADELAKSIINAAVFIILLIVLRIVLIFVKIVSNAITELPIIKQFNKSGGIIYGVLESFLIIYIVFAIIALFVKNIPLEQAINNSYIGSILYNNNLILMLLLK